MRKKVRAADNWRGSGELCKLIFFQPVYQGFTAYYMVPLFRNKIFIQQKYAVEGLSARQIAREIYCSKMAVLDALARFGIAIREPHFHHGHPSQPRFGVKFRKNHLVNYEMEQRVVRMVNELHARGISVRHIARILNQMKIVTKCQGKAWHPEMIRRILEHSHFTDN